MAENKAIQFGILVASIGALGYLVRDAKPRSKKSKYKPIELLANPAKNALSGDVISDEALLEAATAFRKGSAAKELVSISALIGKQVRVFYNLHLLTYSIQVKDKGGAWSVKSYADYIKLENATFKATPGGRDGVRKSGDKNVHAHVYGTLVSAVPYGQGFNGQAFVSASIDPRKQSMYYYDPYCVDQWMEIPPPVEAMAARYDKTFEITSRDGKKGTKTVTCRELPSSSRPAPTEKTQGVSYVEMINVNLGIVNGKELIRPQIWGASQGLSL